MTPLIDGDMLLYECCFAVEYQRKGDNEYTFPDFDEVWQHAKEKISEICRASESTMPPIIFITDSPWLAEMEDREYVANFRFDVAKQKPYKGTRNKDKPFHFYNLLLVMLQHYDCRIVTNGTEADDAMAVYQCTEEEDTIICTRDKDLRQVDGWHFSWETGISPSFGPAMSSGIGRLWQVGEKQKTVGLGWKWFFYQMLVGDTADNIPGCKGVGDKTAYAELEDCTSLQQMYNIVFAHYQRVYKKEAWYVFHEMADLLFILRDDRRFVEYWKDAINV